MTTAVATGRVKVWDLPIRLFHWSLLGCVVLAWRTAETRDLDLHRIAGSAVAGLLVFRLWWGLFGSSTARFSQFIKGPAAVLAYVRTLFSRAHKDAHAGHNPMGALSVAALLLTLVSLVSFGLFAVDTDGLESGPFANLISFDQGRFASHLHSLAFTVLEGLICLHLLALVFYHFVKRQNLVGTMITGHGRGEVAAKPGSPLSLVIGLALGLAVALTLAHLGGTF